MNTSTPWRLEERPVRVATSGEPTLDGDLSLPSAARGLVLFAHGSGSSRFSPRNRYVARSLNAFDLATLLVDLLTPDEEALRGQAKKRLEAIQVFAWIAILVFDLIKMDGLFENDLIGLVE